MLAYDYPILGLFWTMLIFFLWFAWIMLVFRVIIDVFRSDMGGMSKALWAIFVIVIPWLGVLIYLIANGDKMTQRDISAVQQNKKVCSRRRLHRGPGQKLSERPMILYRPDVC